MRSVAVTWDVPESLTRGFDRASVTLAGRNLWMSSDYSGSDPEVEDFRDREEGSGDEPGEDERFHDAVHGSALLAQSTNSFSMVVFMGRKKVE